MRNMRAKWMFIVPAAILGMLLFATIGGGIVQWLWNWLLPELFNLPEITFWQALGLLALSRILVGGFGIGRGSRSNFSHRMGDRMADRMAERVAARWEQMTPEERERFRQGVRARCGFDPATGERQAPAGPS